MEDEIAPLPEPEPPSVKTGVYSWRRLPNGEWEFLQGDCWFPSGRTDDDIRKLHSLLPESSEPRYTVAEMRAKAWPLLLAYCHNARLSENITQAEMSDAIAATFGRKP